MSATEREILDLVGLQLGADRVGPADRLVEELGAESADLMNLVARLEERYGLEIDEEEMARLSTAADVVELVARRLARQG